MSKKKNSEPKERYRAEWLGQPLSTEVARERGSKDDEVRISTDEESREYLDYQLKKSGYTDDEEEMISDDTLSGKGEH